jgi:hypothetical protein
MRLSVSFSAILILSAMACAQMPAPSAHYDGWGPYVPMLTTPEVSFQTVSPNPVGASNATYGLLAGARNSTAQMISGNASSSYTKAEWYAGGDAPLISVPEISLSPRAVHDGRIRMQEPRMEAAREEPRRERAEASQHNWIYFAAEDETSNAVEAAASAKSAKHATRTYTNQDVENENQKNGSVKYDDKTEKIQ